jgi:exodeoxyribonuclease-3
MKILCWNVNGIRACAQKTFLHWLEREDADLVCVQETKAHPDQLGEDLLSPLGYMSTWDSAEKKGYSGVANFSRLPALSMTKGIGIDKFDREGRTLVTEFQDFFLINAYFPNGQRDHARVSFKMEYCEEFSALCQDLRKKGKELVICGDFNTAHHEIDLRNPRENQNTTGFLPIERKWLTRFIEREGFLDIFRLTNPAPHQYTWWSYKPGVRQRNIGWRIDYFFISPDLRSKVKAVYHEPGIMGSDHCPIVLELDL